MANETTGKGFSLPLEQIEKIGDELPGRMDAYRGDAFAGLERVTRSRLVQERRERARLEAKHGADHPLVAESQRRMDGRHRLLVAARMERDRSAVPVLERVEGHWILHGYVRNRDGLAAAGARVTLHPDAEGRQPALAEAQADGRGYYRLELARSEWEEAAAGDDADAPASGGGGNATLATNVTRVEPAAMMLRAERLRQRLTEHPVYLGARLETAPVTMDPVPLHPAPATIAYRDLVLEQTGQGGAGCALRTRYLGNSGTRELHDLEHERSGCRIEAIRPDHRVYFRDEKEAEALGYDYCAYCYGRQRSRR